VEVQVALFMQKLSLPPALSPFAPRSSYWLYRHCISIYDELCALLAHCLSRYTWHMPFVPNLEKLSREMWDLESQILEKK